MVIVANLGTFLKTATKIKQLIHAGTRASAPHSSPLVRYCISIFLVVINVFVQ